MAYHRLKSEWERAAAILSMLYNMNRGPKSPPMKPSEFNPYEEASEPEVIKPKDARDIFSAIARQWNH